MESIAQTLSNLSSFVFIASLKASVLVVLVLLTQRLFGRFLSANGRYLLWLAVVISLVTPIGFQTVVPGLAAEFSPVDTVTTVYEENSPGYTGSVQGREFTDSSTGLTENNASTVNTPAEKPLVEAAMPKLLQVLPWLWLAGVFTVLVTLAYSSSRLIHLVRHSEPALPYLLNILNDCMQKTGCHQKVTMRVSPTLHSPLIAGVFSPVLLWPEGLEQQLKEAQIQHVFIHELMHLKRLDIASNCITAILQGLYWFNPVIWFAFACMRNDREMACDESTIRQLNSEDRHTYAHTLMHLGTTLQDKGWPATGLGILDTRSQLHRRILMLARASLSHRIQFTLTALLFMPLAVLAFSQPVPGSSRAGIPVQIVDKKDLEPGQVQQPSAANQESVATVEQSPVAEVAPAVVAETDALADDRPESISEDRPVTMQQNVIDVQPARPVSREPIQVRQDSASAPVIQAQTNEVLPENPPEARNTALDSMQELPLRQSSRAGEEAAFVSSAQVMAVTAVASSVDEQQSRASSTLDATVQAQQNLQETEEPGTQICRILTAPGVPERKVCDSAERWAEFDQSLQAKGYTSLLDIDADTEAYAIEIEYEVCRYQTRTDNRIQNKECRSPEAWAAYDRIRQNRTDELRRKVFENSGMTMSGAGSTPADMEALSNSFPESVPVY